MKFKRSSASKCINCKTKKFLDIKFEWGGCRYMDRYAVECVWCGIRSRFEYSVVDAINSWNEFIKKYPSSEVSK